MRPVVLLHGAGGSFHSTFVETGWIAALDTAGRSAVGLDLPGHNAQAASRHPSDYADLAGLVLSALPDGATLRDGKFDAVGFSLGAKLLLELALRVPERVGRLVLGGIGDNVFAPESVGAAVAAALEHGPGPATPPAVLAFLKTWKRGATDPLALAAVMRRPPNPVFSPERLAAINHPILIVNGANDPVTTLGQKLTASLTNVQTVVIPQVAHFDLPAQQSFQSVAISFLNGANV